MKDYNMHNLNFINFLVGSVSGVSVIVGNLTLNDYYLIAGIFMLISLGLLNLTKWILTIIKWVKENKDEDSL